MDSRAAKSAGEEARSPDATAWPVDRRQDLFFWLVLLLVLGTFLVFNVLNVMEEHRRAGHPVAFWKPAVWEGTSGVFIMAVTPLVMALIRRVWPASRPMSRKVAILAGVGLVFSLAHVLAIGVMRWGVYRLAGEQYALLSPLGDWPYEARKDLFGYAAVVASYITWRELAERRAQPATPAEVLEVRDGARRYFVPLEEVVWIEAAGNYVELHRGGGELLHRASLAEMERRLQTAGFVRIHRSRLVRREAVAAVQSKPTGDFLVRLRDGRELAGSRRYRHPLLAD